MISDGILTSFFSKYFQIAQHIVAIPKVWTLCPLDSYILNQGHAWAKGLLVSGHGSLALPCLVGVEHEDLAQPSRDSRFGSLMLARQNSSAQDTRLLSKPSKQAGLTHIIAGQGKKVPVDGTKQALNFLLISSAEISSHKCLEITLATKLSENRRDILIILTKDAFWITDPIQFLLIKLSFVTLHYYSWVT